MNILTVALPIRQRARLIGRLKEHTVVPVGSGKEAVEWLKSNPAALIVYFESDEDPLVALAALLPHNAQSRVLFCAKEGHNADFQKQLVNRLRVTAILHHPVDPDELVRRASIELDTKVPTLETRVEASSAIPKALLPVWLKHQETNRERVDTLITVCQQESPGEEWIDAGRRAAHQLAGSLGTFGLATASLLARDAERLVTQFAQLTDEQRLRLEKVVHALQLQLADPQLKLPDLENEAPKGSMLIFSIDPEWSAHFAEAAKADGYQPLLTDDPAGARRVFGLEHPDKVVLDLGDMGQDGMVLVHDLSGQGQGLVALLDPPGNSRLIACKTLTKPAAHADILAALEQAEEGEKLTPRRILAVDDDPIVLETLSALLQALNIEVHCLQDPLNFWEQLAAVDPELVMLDVDLPYVGGVELCRAMRSEPKYFDIPVIFLSAYNDTETVHRVFTAGADDYVFKPIIGPELITRTRNRLRRARLAQPSLGEAPRRNGKRPDVSVLVQDEEISRDLFKQWSGQGLVVEKLTQSGTPLIERLTGPVETRPRVVLLDVLATNDVLQALEGLGVNNYCEVWVRGDLTEEEIGWVYEWGLAGYLPQALPADIIARRLARAAVPN
ncbi:MAG: response regulator [Candidatus Eremiobacteraeota bacterium]|nr:response regulator [Candidatus Eremiobacteraeota bacterium]MCW5867540.1 response regulator [Candidatus Eremiobacteraeota bacterium]